MKVSNWISLMIGAGVLHGCANMDAVYRTHTFDLSKNVSESAIIDAKQREILAANYTICPSPQADVMSAFALQMAGRADIPEKVRAEVVMAAQSSAAYIGVRSRNIQFSRDQSYGLCIDRMNDAVDDGQYNFYKSRLNRYQMAMAAIEQLTDPAITPPVILSSTGSAVSYGLTKAEQAKLDSDKLDKHKVEKNGGPKADGENLTDDEKAKIKAFDKSIAELEEKIRTSASLVVGGSSGGTAPSANSKQTGPSKEVIDAVTKIAISTLLTDDSVLLCIERLINNENQIYDSQSATGYRRDLNGAEIAQLQYCKGVLAGNSTPLMKLHPDILKWVTE